MAARRAIFSIKAGPNQGDTVGVDLGGCRLIGRHLSDNETAFLDRDGNRKLDATASQLLSEHVREQAGESPSSARNPDAAYTRGPDIIFSDDAISRAHAMVYFDGSGAMGIIDLASTNGTFVNDQRVSSASLQEGDRVSLGSSHLIISVM